MSGLRLSAGALLYGLKIMASEYALEETNVRTFPASRHRSRRVHKKLVRRFGGEFLKKPAIFHTPLGLICHPTLYADLQRRIEQVGK